MKKRADVTETELAILDVLWRRAEPLPIAAIVDELYPTRTAATHATVQSLLGRLGGKGCVVRQRSGRAHLYAARVERRDVIGHQLRSLADRLCDGSLTPLLTHLVAASNLSAQDRDELRTLLTALDASPSAKSKRRP